MTADRELRAHLQVTRALARQSVVGERGALLAVVGDLTEATKIFREETRGVVRVVQPALGTGVSRDADVRRGRPDPAGWR